MTDLQKLKTNVARTQQQIEQAAQNSGRQAEDITLVAVTKYVDHQMTRSLVEAGCKNLGENRPQQLWQKADQLSDCDVRWHQIGHLQRNKLARTVPVISLLHSVDSKRLLKACDETCQKAGLVLPILIEVNISGDASKHGFKPDEMPQLVGSLKQFPNVRLQGLMGMASLAGDNDQARREFASLRELRDRLTQEVDSAEQLRELSMGMSRDFGVAIEEGATIVRVGSNLFEGVL